MIRDKLPIKNREDYIALGAWLTDGEDDNLTANHAQLKDFISRGSYDILEKEFVHSVLLRLFTKKFASG